MNDLTPCPSCRRHVLTHETKCPFCDVALALTSSSRASVPPRLGRAATMAFGAAALVAGCAKDPPTATSTSAPPPSTTTTGDAALGATAAPAPAPPVVEALDGSFADASISDAAERKDAAPPKVLVRPPPHPNMAKPYGAPPAAGLRRIV